MKFGFFMMPLHHPSENPTLAFERDLDFIEYVDHLGFDECFIGEHHSAGWETIPAPTSSSPWPPPRPRESPSAPA